MGETTGARAVLKGSVIYCEGGVPAVAPRGEYEIDRRSGCIGLCQCDGACAFTLTFDAFQQHVIEGRIAIAG
ncbi:MAG: hypothetical protein AAFW81_01020 [Pseudomonadota bacterium]